MSHRTDCPDNREKAVAPERQAVSRREFLRLACTAGAGLATGGGVMSVLAGCGTGAENTTSTAEVSSTSANPASASTHATVSTAGSATTVGTSAETGRAIKIGFVTPLTGVLASFAASDKYCLERWTEFAKDGLICGDGLQHPITFVCKDSQSDPNRSSQVAADLILNDKIDLLSAASTPDTVNPAADQAEALGTPCITTDAPADSYFFSRGGKMDTGFKWTYHFFFAGFMAVNTFLDIFGRLPTNKVIGVMFPNDPDGLAWADLWPPLFEKGGFTVVDPGRYQDGMEDYTAMISLFKKKGVEIVTGVVVPSDFVNFVRQSAQQGFEPKVETAGKAMLFPQTAVAIGKPGFGLTCEMMWHPTFPYKSSLTGETCQQLADDFEKRTGEQWLQPLQHYALFEVIVDVLKRTKNVDSKEDIIQAVRTTKMADSVAGPLDWTTPVKEGTVHPFPNIVTAPLVGGQWVPGSKHMFDLQIISNVTNRNIKVQAEMKPLSAFDRG